MLPALALARHIGATAAAALLGVTVERYRAWASGVIATPDGTDLLIRQELGRLRRAEDGEG